MIDMQSLDEHLMLRADHVVICVLRELQPQSVGWLTRLAVANVVGENDKKLGNIERLADAEEDIRESPFRPRKSAVTQR
jgi:hypothetical protein